MSLTTQKLIVIIDDDVDDCYFLQIIIHQNYPGYEVLLIHDSTQVVPRLSALERRPDLIILDLNLTLENGAAVLTRIRQLAPYQQTSVAVLTSLADPEQLALLQRLGVGQWEEKASSLSEMVLTVAKLLGVAPADQQADPYQ